MNIIEIGCVVALVIIVAMVILGQINHAKEVSFENRLNIAKFEQEELLKDDVKMVYNINLLELINATIQLEVFNTFRNQSLISNVSNEKFDFVNVDKYIEEVSKKVHDGIKVEVLNNPNNVYTYSYLSKYIVNQVAATIFDYGMNQNSTLV